MCRKEALTTLLESNSSESNRPESRDFNHWLAAGFGSGWLPKAPGTWGSLASLLPAWFILDWFHVAGLLVASIVVLFIGCRVCAVILPAMVEKDPGWIVIDEWAGQWLCLALIIHVIGDGWLAFVIAFVAFRLFDILKPWPVSLSETAGPPWWSIMADDMVAGLMGAAVVIAGALIAGM